MASVETFVMRDSRADERSLWGKFLDGFRGLTIGPYNTKDRALTGWFGAEPASSGERVNERRALTVAAFWSAATMISGDIGSLPLKLYRRDANGGRSEFTSHPLYKVLHDAANPMMSSMQYRETMMLSALIFGNSYSEIERDQANRPIALWPLLPSAVIPFVENGRMRYRTVAAGGGEVILDQQDVLHVRGPAPDGLVGYPVIEYAREVLGNALAASKYGGRFFANYTQIGGIIATDSNLTPQARENLRNALEARHQGADKAHRLLLLESGMNFTPTSTTPKDSQFLEAREADVREIARYFRVPAVMLGELSRATWSNFEQAQQQYYVQAIRPWCVRIEQEINRTLIAAPERNQQYAEHSLEGFLRSNPQERAEFYAVMLSNGVMTANEIRLKEGLSPIEGADQLRVPLNTTPVTSSQEKG